MKVITALKVIFYVIVIIGIVVYALDLYTSRGRWSASLQRPPEVSVQPPSTLNVLVDLNVYNPSHGKVVVRDLWYNIYINNYFVGEGFKPYVVLFPGNNTLRLSTSIDLSRFPCPLAETFYNGENMTISVSGYAIANVMLFGKLSFRSVMVPFNVTAKEIKVPKLPEVTRSLLYVYIYYCQHSSEIEKALSKFSSLTGVFSSH